MCVCVCVCVWIFSTQTFRVAGGCIFFVDGGDVAESRFFLMENASSVGFLLYRRDVVEILHFSKKTAFCFEVRFLHGSDVDRNLSAGHRS